MTTDAAGKVPHFRGGLPPRGALLCALIGVFFLAVGCEGNRYNVKVDGIRDRRAEFPTGTSYKLLLPPRGEVGENFDYARAESMIKSSMAARGYYPVDGIEQADLVVTVEFGMTPGRVRFEERIRMQGTGLGMGGMGGMGGISGRYPSISPASPESELVSKTVNTKYITFSARDPRRTDEDGRASEVWNLVVRVEDDGVDLERYLPLLLGAAMQYIGEDTGAQVELVLSHRTESVQYVVNDATFDRPTL